MVIRTINSANIVRNTTCQNHLYKHLKCCKCLGCINIYVCKSYTIYVNFKLAHGAERDKNRTKSTLAVLD